MPFSEQQKQIIKLHDPHEFDRRFEQNYRDCNTYKEAYQVTEREFQSVFGRRKYSSYNSFRNAYNQRNAVNK